MCPRSMAELSRPEEGETHREEQLRIWQHGVASSTEAPTDARAERDPSIC